MSPHQSRLRQLFRNERREGNTGPQSLHFQEKLIHVLWGNHDLGAGAVVDPQPVQ